MQTMNHSTWIEWTKLNMNDINVNVSEHHSCPFGYGHYNAVDICILETIIIVLLTFLIIAGNLTVIFVVHCAPLLHHYTTSYFIQTMAYADLFVGISCLIPTLSLLHYSTSFPESLTCQIFGYVISVLKSVSMACLAFISVDRYLAITKPLSYNQLVTPCRLRICITLIWLYSSLIFLPSYFGWGKPGYHGDVFEWCATAWLTNAYFTGFIVCLFYAPAAFIICFTYFHIFRICRQHTKEINDRRAQFPHHEIDPAAETGHNPDSHYAMVLFRITSVFYVLWLPYIIYFMLESTRVLENPALSFVTTWLAISNSFCNCVIYSLSNSVFRLGLWRLSETLCSVCICKKGNMVQDPVPKKRANSCSI